MWRKKKLDLDLMVFQLVHGIGLRSPHVSLNISETIEVRSLILDNLA